MGMNDTMKKLRSEFEELFGDNEFARGRFSRRQMWFIVKVAKGVRLYCRSNKAFNNFFNGIFGSVAKFDQVTKTKPNGETYEGLQITMVNPDGSVIEDSNGGDDE